MKKNILALCVLFILTSCSSFNRLRQKEKIILTASGAGFVGYNVGSASKNENKGAQGTLTGSLAALAVGIASLYLFEPDENPADEKLKQENIILNDKIKEIEKQMSLELISKGTTESEKTPQELKEYLKKGKWERYKLLKWNQDPEDENIYYKITEQIKLIPKESEE